MIPISNKNGTIFFPPRSPALVFTLLFAVVKRRGDDKKWQTSSGDIK